jgi:hypothetical protein
MTRGFVWYRQPLISDLTVTAMLVQCTLHSIVEIPMVIGQLVGRNDKGFPWQEYPLRLACGELTTMKMAYVAGV